MDGFGTEADWDELKAIEASIKTKEDQLRNAELASKNTLNITQFFRPNLQKIANALRKHSSEIDLSYNSDRPSETRGGCGRQSLEGSGIST